MTSEVEVSKKSQQSGRLDWVDIAKGLAMLCIIAGHMGIGKVERIVFTFHVPIFFLISGYFISQKAGLKEFAAKKARGLLAPYWFTSVLLIIAKIPVDIVTGRTNFILYDMRDVLIQALYGSGSYSNKTIMGIEPIGAIWFFLALFWALLIAKIFMDKKLGWLWVLLIAIVSYVSSLYIWLPLDIQAGGTAAVFAYLGAYLKKNKINITFKWWLILIGIAVFVLEVIFDVRVSVARNYYKYMIVSAVGAVLISYAVLWVSKLLDSTKFVKKCLCFVGTNSSIFLCFHLVELNNAPWGVLYSTLSGVPSILQHGICFACKLLFATLCTIVVLKIKWLRTIFSK